MNAYWSAGFNLLSAVIGGGIAGYATIRAQNKSIEEQRKGEEKAETTLIRGFVQAIADEVKSVWDRYNLEIGPSLRNLKDGETAIPFPCTNPTSPFLTQALHSSVAFLRLN